MAITLDRVQGKTIAEVQTALAEVIGEYLRGEKMGEASERVLAVRIDRAKGGKSSGVSGWSGVVDVLSGSDPDDKRGPVTND